MKKRIPPDRRIFFGIGDRSASIARDLIQALGGRAGGTQRDVLFPLFFPPVVQTVSPNHGSDLGGTVVTISGSKFQQGCTVLFGLTPATGIVVNAAGTSITAVAPAHTLGAVDVTVVNPTLQQFTLPNSYTYNDLFVAFGTASGGSNQIIATSDDYGTTWTVRNSATPIAGPWLGGGGYLGATQTFYALQTSRLDWSNDQGVTWHKITSSPISSINPGSAQAVLASTGQYFISSGSQLLQSTDGQTWSVRGTSGGTPGLRAIAYNGSIYSAVGQGGSGAAKGASSPDGITWTSRTLCPITNNETFNNVAWGSVSGGLFVANAQSGLYVTSPDAINWTDQSVHNPALSSIIWAGDRFVGVGGTNAKYSLDGLSWTSVALGFTATHLCWTGSILLAVGPAKSFVSLDRGVSWTPHNMPTANTWSTVCVDKNVAIGA